MTGSDPYATAHTPGDPEALAEALRRFTPHVSTCAIVVDESPSMDVWAPTVAAFQDLAGAVFPRVNRQLLGPFREAHAEPRVPDGELIMVVSDGLAGFWAQSSADQVLNAWGRRVPVAIVNPYPRELWERSLLAPREVQLSAPRIMSPNAELLILEPAERMRLFDDPVPEAAVAVPLLELGPRWLRWWASLVGGPAGGWLDAVAHIADPDRPHGPGDVPATAPGAPGAHRLVEDFRNEPSAFAFRLATLIAAAPPRLGLDALRVLQRVLLPASRPLHLAEVVTSPLLVTGAHGEPSFRAGVREELLAYATREDTVRVIEVVVTHFGDRFPRARDLLDVLRAPDEQPDTRIADTPVEDLRFELAVLRALAGPYAPRADRLERALAGPSPEPPGGGVRTPSLRPGAGTHLLGGRGASLADIDALLQPDARSAVWVNLPSRNDDFTGREEMLDILDRRLRQDRVAAVLSHSLHGMGGVGKSQIAAEYAYRHMTDYDVIWFVPAEQESQIRHSLMELGEHLNIPAGTEANTAIRAVLDSLAAGTPYANWLLIFDNAETLETVQDYLPTGGTGKVLITSRNRGWTGVSETLEIDVFSREESIALLRRRNPVLSVTDADRIADLLDDLPLAIAQAAAWRAATQMDVGEYLRRLTEKRAELARQAKDQHYEVAVATAWTVALEHLGTANPGALQLLQTCSFMAPEPISQEIFQAVRDVEFALDMNEVLQTPNQLGRAIRAIEQYGLARIDYREETFTVQLHRLVREVVVDRLSASERSRMQHAAHLLLAGVHLGDFGKTEHWPRFAALLPHVQASDQVGCEDAWARRRVLDMIEFLYSSGDHKACRARAAEAVERWTRMLGPDDPQVLKCARWLAFVLRILGEFAEAARINADCLQRLRAINGPEDEETLDAMCLVAADRRAAGDFQGALRLDRDAYEISARVFGPKVPHTLRMAHSLGISLRLMGDFAGALALDMETVRHRIDVHGAPHYLTLLTQNGLTLDMREQGQYIAANERQEKLYARIQRILGNTHPQTLMAARNLAVSLRRAGKHEPARKLALDTLKELRERFGDLNPEAIACALNYAVDLRENDELVRSRELAERTWHEYATTLGEQHPYTLYARTNLGIVLRLLGRLPEALEHDRAAYDGLHSRLGAQHVLTLTCATNLGSDLALAGDHQQAYDLDAQTLEGSRTVLGFEHPSTLACALNLAFDLRDLGHHDDYERLFGEVVDAYHRVLGRDHPAIEAANAGERANCDVDPMPL
ncbi:FxSxx-COOH system tetratricopeptide repeat protein [Actinoplanes awajinensis]|uniref:Uncharacterized protein n=1 Tax=Actinoplanes awajinensis subsp. mycoplanecinus TaxID=135947 RepID=A0A124G796_9ACTN|nr:FxSxx-COOH system tetratricopeptide repeat protein [Actinoplanes awajinensis]KUL22000.1 hypothetical protein ADL15_49355 [Actinoplanes awajinensis subsp. mycoplanecinus]